MIYKAGYYSYHLLPSSGQVANKNPIVDRAPSTAAFKRSSARLRRVRWIIYEKIRSKKSDVNKTLSYYKKLVNKFLARFSMKLKLNEFSIWKAKLGKTTEDVNDFLKNKKKVQPNSGNKKHKSKTSSSRMNSINKVSQTELESSKAEACKNCSNSNYLVNFDVLLVSLFLFLSLGNLNQCNATLKKEQASYSKPPSSKENIDDSSLLMYTNL